MTFLVDKLLTKSLSLVHYLVPVLVQCTWFAMPVEGNVTKYELEGKNLQLPRLWWQTGFLHLSTQGIICFFVIDVASKKHDDSYDWKVIIFHFSGTRYVPGTLSTIPSTCKTMIIHRINFSTVAKEKRKVLLAAFSTNGPQKELKSWERGARLVKDTKVENKYLEHIRETHDPSLHIKTIEDELKGSIGKALGKQGEKVVMYLRAMEQERKRYYQLLENHEPTHQVVIDSIHKHNTYRKDCINARWELMVHRQAVGFIVGNQKYVTETFPIGEPLPVPYSSTNEKTSDEKNERRKVFGDQLDWWQRIGRWR